MYRKKRFLSLTGFTLLEILIVVVIIGILAGLAIPKFTKSIETAKGKEAVVNLETIRTAERMYYLDNNSYTSNVGASGDWSVLVPGYLLENPNANPNRNWDYRFNQPTTVITAYRQGGTYGGQCIGIYTNGDFDTYHIGYHWPWPPD